MVREVHIRIRRTTLKPYCALFTMAFSNGKANAIFTLHQHPPLLSSTTHPLYFQYVAITSPLVSLATALASLQVILGPQARAVFALSSFDYRVSSCGKMGLNRSNSNGKCKLKVYFLGKPYKCLLIGSISGWYLGLCYCFR